LTFNVNVLAVGIADNAPRLILSEVPVPDSVTALRALESTVAVAHNADLDPAAIEERRRAVLERGRAQSAS
jgi:hypothetical protein